MAEMNPGQTRECEQKLPLPIGCLLYTSDITDFLGDFSELKTSLLYILKRFNSTLTEIRNLAEGAAKMHDRVNIFKLF